MSRRGGNPCFVENEVERVFVRGKSTKSDIHARGNMTRDQSLKPVAVISRDSVTVACQKADRNFSSPAREPASIRSPALASPDNLLFFSLFFFFGCRLSAGRR